MDKPLRIIFISLIDDVKNSSLGFIVKDLSKAEALNSIENVSCLGVSFSSNIAEDYYHSPFFLVKKINKLKTRKFLSSFYENIYLFNQIDSFLSEQTFDVVLFRYNIASRSMFNLVKKYPKKFIFEHNTFEEIEHKILINKRFQDLPFAFKPGYFIYQFEGRIWPLFCETYFGNKIRKLALAGISVTKEIGQYQINRVKEYANSVVSNGVKYEQNIIFSPKVINNELNAFMLLGTGANWHGVDRVINGIKKYKGDIKINFDIIGYKSEENSDLVKKLGLESQINFIPPISNNELVSLLSKYHVSFGTLGLHRKQLKEASPLKVRESLMRGFPVVIAYHDTDISHVDELKGFVLQVPANDEPINFNMIVPFVQNVFSKSEHQIDISKASKPYIDYDIKARKMVNFIKTQLAL